MMKPEQFISSSVEIEVPKMPSVDEAYTKDVVLYKGRLFELHPAVIGYLAALPQIRPKRIERACSLGMGFMYPDGSYGCHYCNHSSNNLERLVSGAEDRETIAEVEVDGEKVPIGAPIIHNTSEKECRFEELNVKWATACTNGKVVVMVVKKPCVVHEAPIETLVEGKLLDSYEVHGRNFDYPSFDDMVNDEALQKKYAVKIPEQKQIPEQNGFFRRLYSSLFFK
jgi:hypothetical protein